jgi:hypothetical protein
LVSGKERVSEERERGGKVEVEVSKKSKERAREALKKKKTHRSLRDQRVLVPLELPLARGRGALHLDGQVVGDEDEAVGEVVCVEKGQEGKREVRAMARSRTRKSESASMTTLTTFFFFARLSSVPPFLVQKSHTPSRA